VHAVSVLGLFSETINSHLYITHILTPFLEHLSNYKAMHCLEHFGDRVISWRLWPCSPDLNLCSFYWQAC